MNIPRQHPQILHPLPSRKNDSSNLLEPWHQELPRHWALVVPNPHQHPVQEVGGDSDCSWFQMRKLRPQRARTCPWPHGCPSDTLPDIPTGAMAQPGPRAVQRLQGLLGAFAGEKPVSPEQPLLLGTHLCP